MNRHVKLLIGMFFCFAVTGKSFASIGVNWQNQNVMIITNAGSVTMVDDRDTFGQLLWTTSSNEAWIPQGGEASADDPVGTIYGAQSNAYLLDSFIIPMGNLGSFPSRLGVYSNTDVGGHNISLGAVYSIIYSDTNLNFMSTWYFMSFFTNANVVFSPPPAPPDYLTSVDVTAGAVPDGDGFVYYQFQLVPEPASFVLFCLGAVSLAAFRRRRP